MTFKELKESPEIFVNAADVAPVLGVDPQDLREQAKADSSKLGFPVCIIGRRVLIPRLGFLRWVVGK